MGARFLSKKGAQIWKGRNSVTVNWNERYGYELILFQMYIKIDTKVYGICVCTQTPMGVHVHVYARSAPQ